MSKRNKIRVALGSLLTLVIVAACVTVYQSGNDGTPNEKELVQKEDFTDETEVREQKKNEEAEEGKEDIQEETQNVTTSQVEGTRTTEENPEVQEEVPTEAESQEIEETIADQPLAAAQPEMNFTESSLMQWPVEGQIVLDYDMDHTIYFPTLNVYKYSPAIAVSSEVNTPVAAAANGKVLSITNNEETGLTMTMDLGNGYQAIYGQLKDLTFQTDDYVEAGTAIGYVSEPTKYYAKEGANLYFAMKKDGTSLDPLQYLP